MWKCSVVLWCLVLVVRSDGDDQENVLQKPEGTLKDSQLMNKLMNKTDHDIRQTWKMCFQDFTYRCVKLVLTKVVENLPHTGVPIAPGVTLLANSSRSLELVDILRGLLSGEQGGSELLVLHKLRQFISSLSVQFQLEDPALLKKVKTLTEEVVDGLVVTGETGRKKGGGGALLWSAGALAAVGFASLAAVAGKAMMASMMALMLAGLTALRGGASGNGGGGGGHKSSHVEIIKAPAHYELAPAHYEAGTHAFEHDHFYSAPAYEYGRMMAVSRPRVDPPDTYVTAAQHSQQK